MNQSTDLTRRRFLSSVGASAAAVPVALGTASAVAATPPADPAAAAHPDAPLLAAFEGWRAARHAVDAGALEGVGDIYAECDLANAMFGPHGDVLRSHPATTMAGVAVKLRHLFAETMECEASARVVYDGAPVTPALAAAMAQDLRHWMLFDMMQNATKAAGLTIGGEV